MVTGLMMFQKDRANRYGLAYPNTKDNSDKALKKAREPIVSLDSINTGVLFQEDFLMVWVG